MSKETLPFSLFPLLPDEKKTSAPLCPICGEESDIFYIDRWGLTVGCGSCISAKRRKTPAPATAGTSVHRRAKKGGAQHDKKGIPL